MADQREVTRYGYMFLSITSLAVGAVLCIDRFATRPHSTVHAPVLASTMKPALLFQVTDTMIPVG